MIDLGTELLNIDDLFSKINQEKKKQERNEQIKNDIKFDICLQSSFLLTKFHFTSVFMFLN